MHVEIIAVNFVESNPPESFVEMKIKTYVIICSRTPVQCVSVQCTVFSVQVYNSNLNLELFITKAE